MITASTLLLVMLATNIIQYVAIDNAQSHGPIFPLYVLILFFTIKWHEKPRIIWASLIGFIIGLATICRPTEGIMFLIPLLWGTQTKESAQIKWNLVKSHKNHIAYAAIFAFIGVLPQLIYWQIATGFFVYDVGSKWSFLNPFFSVLFGFESGWFIYTPVTIFFILGMFCMKKKGALEKPFPFKKSVIWFCILNIYIIISWFDGNPDATYSCRRLSESYPIFALPLAAFIERINHIKIPSRLWMGRLILYILGIYLIGVNLFQIGQYNKTILHYTDMNRRYYGRIYLNPHPTPLDMSLLDTNDYLNNENNYRSKLILHSDSALKLFFHQNTPELLLETIINTDSINNPDQDNWLKIEAEIKVNQGFSSSYLCSDLRTGSTDKQNRIRLFSPISTEGEINKYAFYMKMPNIPGKSILKLYISSGTDFEGILNNIRVYSLRKS
jgi:hypothetical protein